MIKIGKLCLSIYYTATLILFLALCGCSMVRRAAVQQVGEALFSKITMLVIASDNDPELIWDAMPFALKTMEVMLAQDPENAGLCLSTSSGFIIYANGHLSQQAQIIEDIDYRKAHHLWQRSYNLNLRGRDYALKALDIRYPNFSEKVKTEPKVMLSHTTIEDVPFLYWAAAGWAAAISVNKNDMDNIAELPVIEAMMRRALKLDPNFGDGAIHEFFIAYDSGRSKASGGGIAKAKEHFEAAIKCTGGKKASPYITYAESIAVKEQNLPLFNKLLDQALAVDANGVKKWRLANTVAHKKARWLKTQIPELFVEYNNENKNK